LVTVLLVGSGSVPLHAEEVAPSNEDLRHVRALAEPQVSPDGGRVLIRVTDATADGGRHHLWLVDAGANTARQLTFSPTAFLAKRTEHTQLFRLPMSGGEAHAYELKIAPVVDDSEEPDAIPPKKTGDAPVSKEPIPLDVEKYEPAPDGHMIAVIAQDPQTPGEKKQKDEKADALWVDHDKHRKRLYLLDAESGRLTAVDVPPDIVKVVWSKSGRLIALTESPGHASDLGPAMAAWLVEPANPAHPTQIKELPATIRGGAWSEDGSRFFFRAQARADAPPGYDDLYVLNLDDRSIRNVSESAALGGSLGNEDPVSTGPGVFQLVQLGFHTMYQRISGGKTEAFRFDRPVVRALQCSSRHASCAWLGESGTQPPALYFASQPGQTARLLNTPSLSAKWDTPAVHALRWKNEGLDIEGMLYLPSQATIGKIPLVVEVHGGPTGAFIDSFSPLAAHLLAQGWAVLFTNPRGSTGHGSAFAAANKNDLGGRDLRDILAGVDAVVAAYAIDSNKLALMGYSYGGEMAAFVEGKTNRFKAIVSAAPVIDQQSEYGTEDDSWYDRWFYGKPWEHREDAWRQSPLAYVAQAKTPFMLIQGEGDSVDPLGQSLEMYRALRQQGVSVQLLQYRRDNHGPLGMNMYGFPSTEPWHGFDARRRLVSFIKTAFEKSGGD
jgi:dipeptidyl aminopeptidase/acylaminoacyl peptidase